MAEAAGAAGAGAAAEDTFGIEDLLDFSNEDIAGPIGDDMQSADSSVTAENFSAAALNNINSSSGTNNNNNNNNNINNSSKIIRLIDRDFTVPAPVVDFEWLAGFESSYGSSSSSSKILLGSAREEAEKENHQQQHHGGGGGGRRLYMTSPVSVLESCATSAMISVGAAGGTGGMPPAVPPRSKRGRPITPSSRILLASCSATSSCEDEEEDDDDEEEEDEEHEEHEEHEEEEDEEEETEEEEEEEEEEGSIESDCALSTESEVVTEDDIRPAKRQCKAAPVQQIQLQNPEQQQEQQQQVVVVEKTRESHHQQPQRLQQRQRQSQAAVVKNWQQMSAGMGDRRCSHCQTQKTPQWRAGPMGPKTLCNACGVRYKSGRLLPEYRPAGSPSYSSEVHSNSHRKVLEMRRQREAEVMRRMKHEAEVELISGEIVQG